MRREESAAGTWTVVATRAAEVWKHLQEEDEYSAEGRWPEAVAVDENGTERPALRSWLVPERQLDADRRMSCHI
jgi:hypothetical protein